MQGLVKELLISMGMSVTDIIISSTTCNVTLYYVRNWEYMLYTPKQVKENVQLEPPRVVSASSVIYNISTILLVNTIAEEFLRILAVSGGVNNVVYILISVVIVRSLSHIILTLSK